MLEVGAIFEGKVTGVTKFGAFVEFDEGKKGMVHISEVSNSFVSEIKEFVKEGDTVKVKVIAIADDGKIALSIKKAMPVEPKPQVEQNRAKSGSFNQNKPNNFNRNSNNGYRNDNRKFEPKETKADFSKASEPASFEDMLSKFKKSSDEKFSGMKKPAENRRGGSRRGNSNGNKN